MRQRLRNLILASLLAALTAAGAFIKIPTPYVPLTLQTLFVFLAADLLGKKYGALSQLIYLTLGLLGLPLFAQGGGPGYVLQPTFGYLIGCPVGAFVIGWMLEALARTSPIHGPRSSLPAAMERSEPDASLKPQTQSILHYVIANAVGAGVIFAFGVAYLFWNVNHLLGKPLSLSHALKIGVLIFLPGDLVKIAVAASIASKLHRLGLVKRE